MFSKIASITLPIFTLVLVGFLYSRRVKPDLGGSQQTGGGHRTAYFDFYLVVR